MIVVKVYMWPHGDQSEERLLTQATIDFQGEAKTDAPGVVRGERAYRVQLLKEVMFNGPREGDEIRPTIVSREKVWKGGFVRGHLPGVGQRGTWDLIGGALKVLLGERLDRYQHTSKAELEDHKGGREPLQEI
jgi:hypothetical protein